MSSSPLSAYEMTYVHLSDEERTKLHKTIEELLLQSVEEANKNLILSVQKAATAMYTELLSNPWPRVLKENAGTYEFLDAVSDQVWQIMLKSNPKELNRARWYSMQVLIDAWMDNFPGEWEKLVDNRVAQRVTELQTRIKYLEQDRIR